ncbi:MAG: hypothetical protein HY936_01485 [Nitrosomonadales bacterium]|nr:hypothetical protein [Nitrosomonadales bacterium]
MFISGIVAGATIFYALGGSFPVWLPAFSGILVGFGMALARGCTSGHGVCGPGRLHPTILHY